MMNIKRSGRVISRVSELPESTQFVLIYDDSYSEMGHDYGPPDPPPTMETVNHTSVIGFDTEAELIEWVTRNDSSYSKKRFVILPFKPLKIQKELSIKIG